jgi:hypothetical protein
MDDSAWQVLGLTENPVPGDPETVASLAARLLDQGNQAQQRAERLLAVHANNTGRMQGDYAAGFDDILAQLPAGSGALGDSYQGCGQALYAFAEELTGIQQQAGLILERGQQADAYYQQAADQFCGTFDVPFPEADEPGGIWRGMNAAWAENEVRNCNPEFEMLEPAYQVQMMEEAGDLGQYAAEAEADRQAAIMDIQRVIQEYQDAASQCANDIQTAKDQEDGPTATQMRQRALAQQQAGKMPVGKDLVKEAMENAYSGKPTKLAGKALSLEVGEESPGEAAESLGSDIFKGKIERSGQPHHTELPGRLGQHAENVVGVSPKEMAAPVDHAVEPGSLMSLGVTIAQLVTLLPTAFRRFRPMWRTIASSEEVPQPEELP